MPRVGIEVEGAGDPNALLDAEKARAKRQKELLKKKRAERRAHARQRAEKAQREQEEEQERLANDLYTPVGEQVQQENSVQATDETVFIDESSAVNPDPVVTEADPPLAHGQSISSDVDFIATENESVPVYPLPDAIPATSNPCNQQLETVFTNEVAKGDAVVTTKQDEAASERVESLQGETPALIDVESGSTMTAITMSTTTIEPDAAQELVPKSKGKRKKKNSSKSNAHAAATTIQQALKKNFIKCKSLVRHSSKVFAADEVIDSATEQLSSELLQEKEAMSGRMSMERLFPKLPSSNKIQPLITPCDDTHESNREVTELAAVNSTRISCDALPASEPPEKAIVEKQESRQKRPEPPIASPSDPNVSLKMIMDPESTAGITSNDNNHILKQPDIPVQVDSSPAPNQRGSGRKRVKNSSSASASSRSRSPSSSRSSASYSSSASSSCSCSSSASCSSSSSEGESEMPNNRLSRPTRSSKNHAAKKDGPSAALIDREAMAVRIQAHIRGMFGRKRAHLQREVLEAELRAEAEQELEYEASVAIQARARGFLARQSLKAKRKRKRTSDSDEPGSEARGEATSNSKGGQIPAQKLVENDDDKTGVWPDELNLEAQDDWQELSELASASGERVTHERFLSRGLLRVLCGTWNMHAKKPADDDLRLWILRNKYHIVAIGTEECVHSIAKSVVFTSKKSWEKQLTDALGSEYSLVASHALTAIHHAVFVHESVMPLLSHVQSDAVATGLGNQLGNKGGVGVSLLIGGTSFLFVNCHFEAHQRNVERRNANFHRINQELKLYPPATNSGDTAARTGSTTVPMARKSMPPVGGAPVGANGSSRRSVTGAVRSNSSVSSAMKRLPASDRFDRVFWFGDLNYRVNGTRRMVDQLLLHDQHAVLRFNDQLSVEMARGRVFPHFREGPLHFRPTYKFDKRSAVYDSSPKQRIPSWTDRVLFRSNGKLDDVRILGYRSHMSFQSSDHRPVGAVFEVAFSHPGSTLPITARPTEQQKQQQQQQQSPPAENEFGRVVARGYRASESKSEVCCVQ